MSRTPQITRFAPSPTGALHLGNARTALLNHCAAQGTGGRMALRIEDTDAARNDLDRVDALLADLRWLGIAWQEGPDVGGPHGPYLQSARADRHAVAVTALQAAGRAYPCFCSPEELQLSRRAQLAAGRPPRYAGTCAALDAAVAARRLAAGEGATLRFRVPAGRVVEFTDLVHGPQRFASDELGDFVLRRADGSVAFLLGNALDDAAMGITLVLRGDDHLANTPWQLLLLEALGLPAPRYGHLPLLLGADGAPLSKRTGAASLAELRAAGYLPGALQNYLARLGNALVHEGWLASADLAHRVDLGHLTRSAAHFDEAQLRHWQREAVLHAEPTALLEWLGERLVRLGSAERRLAFLDAVRGNLLFPSDADPLVAMVCDAEPATEEAAAREMAAAGAVFFERAAAAWRDGACDFRAWTRQVGEDSGRRGAALYLPLRAALTGRTHGPELAPLVALMGPERVEARLRRAATPAAAA
jgi:glutamyl-tRNA synthetase